MISIDQLIVGLPKIHANQIQPNPGDETKSTEECALIAGLIKYAHLQAGTPALVKVGLKTISFWQGFPPFLSRPVKMKIHSSEKLRAAGLKTHIMQKSLGKFFVLLPSDQMIRHLSRGGR